MNIFEQRKKEKEAEDAAKKAAEQPRPKALPLDEGIAIAPPPVPADPAKQPQPPPDKPTPTDIFRQRRDEARQDLPSPQAPPIPSLPHVEPPKPAQPLSIPAPEVKPPTEPLKEIQKVEPEPQPLPEPKAVVRPVEKPDPVLDVVRDLNAATTANMMEQIGKLEEKVDRVFDDFAEDLGGGESSESTFAGVMLVGIPWVPGVIAGTQQILGTRDATTNYLHVDMRLFECRWEPEASTNWWVDSIPVSLLSGLLIYATVPHYVEDE